jgi:hypothetical protein
MLSAFYGMCVRALIEKGRSAVETRSACLFFGSPVCFLPLTPLGADVPLAPAPACPGVPAIKQHKRSCMWPIPSCGDVSTREREPHRRSSVGCLSLHVWPGVLEAALLVKRERFPEHPFAPISCMSVFSEAKRPPRRLGRLHPLDERQAGPGGLGMGAGVCGATGQGGSVGFVFFLPARLQRTCHLGQLT